MNAQRHPVVIVGAGVSGLSTALRLADAGARVTLVEEKPHAGGRAYSFADPVTGDEIDNGQHLLIAAYTRTLAYLDRIGTRELLEIQKTPELTFHHPDRGICRFRVPDLPYPSNLLAAVMQTGLFSAAEKFRILAAGTDLLREQPVDAAAMKSWTVARWLQSLSQPPEVIRSFWEPLAVAIMNQTIDEAPADLFRSTLRTAFLVERGGAALATPRSGLSPLLVDGALRALDRSGARILFSSAAESLCMDHGSISGIRLRSGEVLHASAVVCSVPPHKLSPVLGDSLGATAPFADLRTFAWTPIVSVHLWLDRPVLHEPILGLVGRRVQWLFNKQIHREPGKPGYHLSAVISAATGVVDLSNDDLVRLCFEDIGTVADTQGMEIVHQRVIREKKATYAATPQTEKLRPGPDTPVRGLFLSGDWTDTGLPATIESAVRSGERAAEAVVAYLG